MRVFDAFCGAAGGWSLGLHRAGYRTVAACEIDPWRRSAFLQNFPGVEMFDDVRAVTARALRERLGYLPEVIVGSPPCQDASSANLRGLGLDGERTGLFREFIRICGECGPRWCAAENVAGLSGDEIDRLCAGLESQGFTVWPLLVGADDFGAPHRRERLVLVGIDADEEGQSELALDGEVGGLVGPHPWAEPWADAAPRFRAVADGLPADMAAAWAGAIGDSILPQLTEAIGRAMKRLIPAERVPA